LLCIHYLMTWIKKILKKFITIRIIEKGG